MFLVLCRGLQSFGKIVFGLMFFSFAGFIAVCSKLLTLINFETVQNIFPATDWQEFFVNSKSWISAAQETFLTWGLLGASVFSMYCKTGKNVQLNKVMLRREAFIIVLVTLLGLFLASILGSSCVQILNNRGFLYFPGSFENTKSNIFLWPSDGAIPPHLASIPSKWITRYSTVLGETCKLPIYSQQQSSQRESGYQAIRLVTELFPSALASVTHQQIQPIWALIGFLTMLLFGLGQLCAMWKPIAGAIGNSPSAILLSCVTGLFLGIPLATDSGIVIIHFLDYIFGGAWWLLIVWASYLVALFMIRGRPYTSESKKMFRKISINIIS